MTFSMEKDSFHGTIDCHNDNLCATSDDNVGIMTMMFSASISGTSATYTTIFTKLDLSLLELYATQVFKRYGL